MALCLSALQKAILAEEPPEGVIHHSDRGVQYACEEYRLELANQKMIPSMSAKGYCYDKRVHGVVLSKH